MRVQCRGVLIYHFKCPYKVADNGSSDSGLYNADGHIEYEELHTFITEIRAGFAHPHAYGVSEYTFLTGLTGRPIHNLEHLECPECVSFNDKSWCIFTLHRFPKFS